MSGQDTHRLTDIDTDEVSIVDEAANGRRFLVVKSKESNVSGRAGSEVEPDGKGGHQVKKNGQEPAKLQLSITTKASLLKGLGDVQTILKAAHETVTAAEETGTTNNDVPGELAEQVAKAATGLAVLAPQAVEKAGFKQFTPERLGQLQAAADTLSGILTGVKPAPAPVAAVVAAAPTVDAEQVTKVAKSAATEAATQLEEKFAQLAESVAKATETVVKSVKEQADAVNKQADRLTVIEKSRGISNAPGDAAGTGGGNENRTKAKKAGAAWGNGDLSAQRVKKNRGNEPEPEDVDDLD